MNTPTSAIPAPFDVPATANRRDDTRAPRVAVLLATYNGLKYLPAQLDSILSQRDCRIDVWISDDSSTDGTLDWLNERQSQSDSLRLLPKCARFGNAARNFYRLLRDADLSNCDYVALADQDDIWVPAKLELSIRRLSEHGAQAFSSNVMAFWPDGRQRLLKKSQPQRRFDFMFESGGPGCTYVLTQGCALELQAFVRAHWQDVNAVEFHDWMIYAWARSHGKKWHIEASPTMQYRQHANNVFGANSGLTAFRRRLRHVRSGWYRRQVLQIAALNADGSSFTRECVATIQLVSADSVLSKARLIGQVRQMRRSHKDRLLLVFACLCGGL